MDRELFAARPIQVALAVLVLALGVAAWTSSRALRIDPVPPATPPTLATEGALAKPGMVVPADIGAVVALNLFSPDRKAPSRRYRLAGYAEDEPTAPPPTPVVLGTSVASGDRSFAICRVGDGPATVVRLNERIGGFTVKAIERGRVVFATPLGERLEINANRP
jgi:hypothetical protein